LIALELPQVLGGGYGWIQQAIDGHLPLALLATLVVAKSIAFALTVGSGGSGGVFGPGLYVGAMVGGVVASLFGAAPAGFVIVGMAAVFAGAARTPVATLLMVTEMTEGYGLLVPAALAVSLGFIVQAMLTRDVRNPTLYEAQVNRRADSPSHHVDQIIDALRVLRLGTVKIADREAIDLATLLRAEVRVEIAEGRRLRLIRADQRSDDRAGDLLAVLRDGDVRMPRSDRAIQDDDLLLIAETRPTVPDRLR
jgi:CIC family chloride channel protein